MSFVSIWLVLPGFSPSLATGCDRMCAVESTPNPPFLSRHHDTVDENRRCRISPTLLPKI